MNCRICDSTGNHKVWKAREMMIGLRDQFTYFECIDCGCLQIADVPADLSKYYSTNYYSLNSNPEVHFRGRVTKKIKQLRDFDFITGRKGIGWIIQRFFPNRSIELGNFKWANLTTEKKILDVGSGTGTIPYVFKNAGFSFVKGIDPYLDRDIRYDNGLVISKRSLLDLDESEKFDLVMFNHSFEHVDKPYEYLRKVYSLLAPRGICIIRIPTVSSHAWKEYGINWVQLDAPRHIFLFSRQSLNHLAGKTSFEIERVTCESTSFQFIGSEQYKMDIAMGEGKSYFRGNSSLFKPEQVREFEERARQLNDSGEGDSIAVILRKKQDLK